MIFFKDLPTDEQAIRNLQADLKASMERNLGGSSFTDEELADLTERGAALALATLRGMDDNLREAVKGLDDADASVVQAVALMQIGAVAKRSLEALTLQSFFKMLFGRRPR